MIISIPQFVLRRQRGKQWLLVRYCQLFLIGLASFVMPGCIASGTSAAKPKIVTPEVWSSSGANTIQEASGDLSRWWERFDDPTLSDLIVQALKNNTGMRTAQARLREARAQRNLAADDRFPSLSASASTSNTKSNVQGGSSNVLSAFFDASWEPDAFGAKRNALRGSEADLRKYEANLHDTQVSLVAEVAADYVDLRSAQERLEIARKNASSQAETLQITMWREQAGLVGSSDVEQARSNLEQTRAEIPSFETDIEKSKHRLGILLGFSPGALSQQLATAKPVPSVPDSVAVGIPADTLRQRPDVRAAEATIIAETARLREQEAARYPNFSLSGSIGLERLLGGSSVGAVAGGTSIALSGGTTTLASFTGTVAQTIFDRGRIREKIAFQNAVQEQAVISYESTVLTALEDVENALVSLEKTRERLASLNVAAESARNAALLAQNRYSAGLVDFQTVLDTERSVLTLEDSVAQTKASRTTALIQLYKALGGGWAPDATAHDFAQQGSRS